MSCISDAPPPATDLLEKALRVRHLTPERASDDTQYAVDGRTAIRSRLARSAGREAGSWAFSVDAKNKALVGNFANGGCEWRPPS